MRPAGARVARARRMPRPWPSRGTSGRNGLIGPPRAWDFDQPEDFDAAVADPDEDELRKAVLVDSDAGALAERIAELARSASTGVYLHHVGKDQDAVPRSGAEAELLPRLREESL